MSALRRAGTAACYTMDAGPHVKVLAPPESAAEVQTALSALPGVVRVLVTGPGPDASELASTEANGLLA